MNGHECENDKDPSIPTKKSNDDTMLPIKSGNKRYGDIVIWLWWTIVVPIHGKELWDLGIWHEAFPGALVAYLSLVAACGLAGMSVYTGKIFYSRLAFAANVWAMTAIHIFDWPFPGDCAITPMMVGGTFIGVLANGGGLSYYEKMLRLPVYFGAGSYAAIHHPVCNYEEETRPILGGTVLLEMMILFVVHCGGIQKILQHEMINGCFELNVAHLARMVLAGLFLHHLTITLLQLRGGNGGDYQDDAFREEDLVPIAESFFVLVKASVIACVGVAATGTFQEEINSKQRAERKAKEEAMMSKAMADSMMVLTHELRTPLQGIMGSTSMLLQEEKRRNSIASSKQNNGGNEKDTESLKLIMASSGLLLNLINNMLDVKRVAEGMMEEFPLTIFPAADPIKDAIGFCLPLASISNVTVVADYGDHPCSTEHFSVRSNALRLQQVLINLISNAIKYTNADGDEKSVIKVSLRASTVEDVNWHLKRSLASSRKNDTEESHGDSWSQKPGSEKVLLFGVSDGGPGIDRVQADRLFRRFGRLDNKPKRTLGSNKVGQPSGTGLGLHLCQLFVQRMEGQIWATNNDQGEGATFFFCLPLGRESKYRPKAVKRSSIREKKKQQNLLDRLQSSFSSPVPIPLLTEEPGESSDSTDDQERISIYERRVLMVDDTLINRKILNRMMKQLGFSKLKMVGSGQAALKELYNARYDLVITDLNMPGMNGMELSEAILNINDEYFQTPVVVGLTADTGEEVVEKCKSKGMQDVIHKPITVDELREFFEKRISILIDQNQNAHMEA